VTDYQGNSNKSKEQHPAKGQPVEKKLEKAVFEQKVVARKKPLGLRIKEVIFGGEVNSAGRYIAGEVLLPAFRNLLVEATTKGIERMVYGDSAYDRRPTGNGYKPKFTYNNPINSSGPRRPQANLPDQPRQRPRHDDTEIIFGSRSDAELVLERLQDVIDQFQVTSMADLNEIVGLQTSHIDHKWGWENVRFAEIRQTRDGFVLNLPPAQPI
jgi:hypothetical protein